MTVPDDVPNPLNPDPKEKRCTEDEIKKSVDEIFKDLAGDEKARVEKGMASIQEVGRKLDEEFKKIPEKDRDGYERIMANPNLSLEEKREQTPESISNLIKNWTKALIENKDGLEAMKIVADKVNNKFANVSIEQRMQIQHETMKKIGFGSPSGKLTPKTSSPDKKQGEKEQQRHKLLSESLDRIFAVIAPGGSSASLAALPHRKNKNNLVAGV